MEELTLAIVLMGVASIVIFFIVRRLLLRARPFVLDSLATAIVLLIGVYVQFVWDQHTFTLGVSIGVVMVNTSFRRLAQVMNAAEAQRKQIDEAIEGILAGRFEKGPKCKGDCDLLGA